MRRDRSPVSRPALLAPVVLAATLLSGVWGAAQEGASPRATKPETAQHRYKNIKVLKNLPADELIPVMRRIDASLGVTCGFCHVVNPDRTGFERDDKPEKGVARQMIVMTNNLNAHQKILNRKATCYMCHHGRPTPETEPPAVPPRPAGGQPPAGGTPPGTPAR